MALVTESYAPMNLSAIQTMIWICDTFSSSFVCSQLLLNCIHEVFNIIETLASLSNVQIIIDKDTYNLAQICVYVQAAILQGVQSDILQNILGTRLD